jgi:hypothetical protein
MTDAVVARGTSAGRSAGWAGTLAAVLFLLAACGGSGTDEPRAAAAGTLKAAASADPARTRGDAWQQHKRFGREPFDPQDYVSPYNGPGRFALAAPGRAAPLVVSSSDHAGVLRVAGDLQADIQRVTQQLPAVHRDAPPAGADEVVILGTLGRSPLLDRLVQSGQLDVTGIAGRWETHLITVLERPLPGVRRALVIAGSDQRGTIYGAYDLSAQIGVSPWHWWDDVLPRRQSSLYVLPGRHSQGEPAVKYRGIFINDENPALGSWVPGMFGPAPNPRYSWGFNHLFYARVFEVMLRLKANYIWPAVWGKSLWDDDPRNQTTAIEYGLVLGTSHEAPMMRAQDEWNRYGQAGGPYGGTGEFSFRRNPEALKRYWKDSMVRAAAAEKLVTVGMRGNGDTGLEDGFAIDLMRSIVESQRQIIAEVTGRDPATVPQVWTLYKEVQRYWDAGLDAPQDITLIYCDDNWGNIRKLPDLSKPARAGGYGIYYHFDYVGGGRNYKWVDTNLLPNIWEQMHMAYRYGVDRVWVVNVGDLKNNELPMQFFLDYAWNPERWPLQRLGEWERRFAQQQFGPERAAEIAEVLRGYARLQSDRKPELLNRRISLDPNKNLATDPSAVVYTDDTPFSLIHYREMEQVVEQWQELAAEAERIGSQLPAALQDAYYQLVLYQVAAGANLYELRLAEFRNILYAAQGRAAAAVEQAAIAQDRFADDQAMSDYYNHTLAGGKWRGFQTQPKIGYGDVARYGPNAAWQQPETDNQADPDFIYPPLKAVSVPAGAQLGVAIDGSDRAWPAEPGSAVLPTFSPYQGQPTQYIEVFNRGSEAFDYQISAAVPWVSVRPAGGRVDKQVRATVHVNWSRAPKGTTQVPITVTGAGGSVVVQAVVEHPDVPFWQLQGFVEANGVVAMEAESYTRAVNTAAIRWKRIPDLGRTGAGLTPFPPTAPSQIPGGATPRLEYRMHLFSSGPVQVTAYLSPRNNVLHGDGLKYAVSIDDAAPQVVNIHRATNNDDTNMNRPWERNTSDNVNRTTTTHTIDGPGEHVLKFWMVDPTVVLQKLVVNTGGAKASYFGPPESFYAGHKGHDRRDGESAE